MKGRPVLTLLQKCPLCSAEAGLPTGGAPGNAQRRTVPHPTDNLTAVTTTDVHNPVSGPGGLRETLQPTQNPADPK